VEYTVPRKYPEALYVISLKRVSPPQIKGELYTRGAWNEMRGKMKITHRRIHYQFLGKEQIVTELGHSIKS